MFHSRAAALALASFALLAGVRAGLPPSVSVTPDNSPISNPQNSGPHAKFFTVTNTGSEVLNLNFACSATGGISCVSVQPTSVTDLVTGGHQQVLVNYNVGATGGQVRLTASGDATDQGSYTVSLGPSVTLLIPVLTSGSRAVVRNRQPVIRATFTQLQTAVDSTKTVLKWRGETVTALARANRGLIEWEVDSTRWLAIGDSAEVSVTVCPTGVGTCAEVKRWAVLENDNKPVLGFTGMPFEALGRQFGSPFGPGLSVSSGEVETGFATPSYVSMGVARSAGLVYSTRTSYPRALVLVDLELTWPAGTPDSIKLSLFDGATKRDSLYLGAVTCATDALRRCRAVLQADFSGSTFATPTRKWLRVEARIKSGGTAHTGTDSVEVVIVDRRSTSYGSGWWPAGFLKLVAAGGDRLLVGPTGTVSVFRGNGDSLYISPPGDFTTLVKVGSGWELRPRGTTAKLVFDSNGRLRRALDANGNRDSISFNAGSDQVASLIDPIGKAFTFTYDGGDLATITDPGSRQSAFLIDGTTHQLTYDSLASPTGRPYTTRYVYTAYPGTSTVVLTKRIGVIGATTVVTYDSTFRRRASQVTLPEVRDETGAAVKPVITYTAYERQGVAALRSLDSVYVEIKDPRNNWTRSLLSRWGQARKTWDAIGLVGRTEFTVEGLVLWSEGKTADSSRVYSTYDSFHRLARSYIVRAANDTLRLDSLVYDASHRVIQRVDPRGKITRFEYDANGNVIRAITPADDTTRFWYRIDGLVDSLRPPGSTASRRFTYETTWRNRIRARDEAGNLLDSTVYGQWGRDSISLSKIRVLTHGTSSQWQWRRVQHFYTVANQVDSTRFSRTDNCSDPCNTPPAWPAASDTMRTQRTAYRFDRAGRDSLRLNDRGKAVEYLYDRLGRLVRRRPWTDSANVKDSFAYDVAGNLRRTVTRRGDTIVTNFDTRNRDTLALIPAVGTVRKTYAGPLDQLTRMWVENSADSIIGGVNAELRWGYDQRGRLKADTSYRGSAAQATTYTYDSFERPNAMADPLGTWTTRYEADRGMADTLLTPMGDTITYTFDERARALGPEIRSGGVRHSRSPAWSASGTLSSLQNSSSQPSYVSGLWDRAYNLDPSSPVAARFFELHSANDSGTTFQDSVEYDGWGRVRIWFLSKSNVALRQDTLIYGRTGNIWSSSGQEVYDSTTDRLLRRQRPAPATLHSRFTYDRAGNLVQAVDSSSVAVSTWVYGYDPLNRLRSVHFNGTLVARYAYDVLGRRIVKRVYSGVTGGSPAYTRFVYHGDAVAFETDSAGAIGLRFTWGRVTDDLLAIQDAGGNHFYVVQDPLSSVRGLIKRDGTWVASYRYAPYGEAMPTTGDSGASGPAGELRYGWTGREFDGETGWYFFRSRYYDPQARRFVQEDAIGYAGGGNLYAYGEGNPLDGRDSDGLMDDYEMMYDIKDIGRCFSMDCRGPAVYIDGALAGYGGGSLNLVLNMIALESRLAAAEHRRAYRAAIAEGAYEEYRRRALAKLDRFGLPSGDPYLMTEEEYLVAIHALAMPGGAATVALLTIGSGAVAVDRFGSPYTSCCSGDFHPGATLESRSTGAVMSFVHPGVFSQGPSFIANVFIHEVLHYQFQLAARYRGQQPASLHCWIYAQANAASGYNINPPGGLCQS